MLWMIKHVIYIWNCIWIIIWSHVDLNILVIPRITSRFGWVELTYFVDCLMECIWVESYRHMNVSDHWYSFHKIQYSYISLYLAFGKFNWKLCTLQWNWQIVFGFESLFLVKDECTTICSVIGAVTCAIKSYFLDLYLHLCMHRNSTRLVWLNSWQCLLTSCIVWTWNILRLCTRIRYAKVLYFSLHAWLNMRIMAVG